MCILQVQFLMMLQSENSAALGLPSRLFVLHPAHYADIRFN